MATSPRSRERLMSRAIAVWSALLWPALAHAEPTPKVRLGALVQVDATAKRQSSQDELDATRTEPLNDDRFTLRRARLRVQATERFVGSWLELDANTVSGVALRPFEAAVAVGWPDALAGSRRALSRLGDLAAVGADGEHQFAVTAAFGLVRIPFGLDAQEPLADRPFLERARATRALFAEGRDVGAAVDAAWGVVRGSLAVQNGEPLGSGTLTLRDPNRGKDVAGRLGVELPLGRLELTAGVSALAGSGFSAGTARGKDQLGWVDDNDNGLVESSELTVATGAPAVPSSNFRRNALGADARLAWTWPAVGRFTLRAEVVRAADLARWVEPADPVRAGRSSRELGFQLSGAVELGGHALVAVRFDRYDPDTDRTRTDVSALVPADRSYDTTSIAVRANFGPLRWWIELDREHNALGRAPNGAPTTLADDRLQLRVEALWR